MDHYDSTSQIHQKDRLHTSNALTTQSRADTQKQFPALIQVFLSPHFSSDASVVSGNSLQKIEKKKNNLCAVFEMQREEQRLPAPDLSLLTTNARHCAATLHRSGQKHATRVA